MDNDAKFLLWYAGLVFGFIVVLAVVLGVIETMQRIYNVPNDVTITCKKVSK